MHLPVRGLRRAATTATLGAAALALAACGGVGGSGSSGTAGSSSDPDKAAGRLTTSGFGLGDEIATVRVDRFKKAYPKVSLKVNEGAFDPQPFLSAVASGNPPDAVYMDREVLGTYAARGALQPLDDCVDKAGIALDDFRKPAVDQLTLDGTLYGIPEFYDVRILMMDRQVLTDAGIDPQQVSTADWDRLRALQGKLTARSGGDLQRIGVDPKLPEFLPLWAKANGADLVSQDGTTAQLDDPKVVEALQLGTDLIKAAGGWSTFKAFRDGWDFFGEHNQFVEHQIGIVPLEDWYLGVLADASPDVPLATAQFVGRDGTPVTFATGNAWAIPKGAENPGAACAFIQTMTDKDTWIAAARAKAAANAKDGTPYTGTFTGNAAADRVIFSQVWKPTGNKAIDVGVRTALDAQSSAFTTPASPAASEVKDAWFEAVNQVLAGKATPEHALAAAQKKAQSALDQAAKAGQ
jgi:multiple sugar transport system substrate-binding protein